MSKKFLLRLPPFLKILKLYILIPFQRLWLGNWKLLLPQTSVHSYAIKVQVPFILANLVLQFVNQFLHPFGIFPVLILSESQLLDTSFTFSEILCSVTKSTLLTVKFSFREEKNILRSNIETHYLLTCNIGTLKVLLRSSLRILLSSSMRTFSWGTMHPFSSWAVSLPAVKGWDPITFMVEGYILLSKLYSSDGQQLIFFGPSTLTGSKWVAPWTVRKDDLKDPHWYRSRRRIHSHEFSSTFEVCYICSNYPNFTDNG